MIDNNLRNPDSGGAGPEGLDGLDRSGVLAYAVARRRVADRAEAELLAVAAHWADLHAVLDGAEAAGFRVAGMEVLVPLAGDGTPDVAEFAPAELGAALGISTYAGQLLIGDALELVFRPPPCAHKIGIKRVLKLVDAALIRFDPEEAARDAKAVGVLADPRGALDLLHPDPATGDTAHHNEGGTAGSTAGGRPKVVLYLHLHQDAVRTGTGVSAGSRASARSASS